MGFGCHPVVLGGEVAYSGPDFIGELRRRVELLRGGICIFFQGAAGNVLPLEAFIDHPGAEIAMGARLGLEAVHAVIDKDPRVIEIKHISYGSVTPISLYRKEAVSPQPTQPIASLRKVLNLPLNSPLTIDEMEKELADRQEDFDSKIKSGAGRDLLNPIGYHISWLTEILQMAKVGTIPEYIEGEIWVARMGDTAIVGTPGELFTELGAEVRRRSPFETTIFAGYCQGVLGYVSTAEEYQWGGYEPTVAQRGYGHPAPFSPEAGRILVEESVLLLEKLKMNYSPISL